MMGKGSGPRKKTEDALRPVVRMCLVLRRGEKGLLSRREVHLLFRGKGGPDVREGGGGPPFLE